MNPVKDDCVRLGVHISTIDKWWISLVVMVPLWQKNQVTLNQIVNGGIYRPEAVAT